MSKKHKVHHNGAPPPQSQPPSLGMWIGAALILAGVVLVFLWLQSEEDSSPNPSFVPVVTGAPRLAVVEDTLDYGDVQFEKKVNAAFRIQNVGDQPLVLEQNPQVELVEGC